MRALIRIGRHPLFASAAAVSISPPLVARPTLPAVPLGGPIAERQSPGDTAQRRALWWLAAAGVVLLGALLRLWRLDLAEFKLDELAVTRLVFALTQQGQWPARGIPSSLGTNNSPLVVYLLALPALVRATPLALTAFVALLNVAGIAGTLWFARHFFGAVAALVAGVLFATTPWAVVYSRKIWEQDLLPPLVLLFFLGLFLVVVERKPRWLLLCGASAAIAVQLHPSAVVLPAIGLLALLRWPRRFPWRFLVLAAVVTLLLLLPYLLMESRIGFADWAAALSGTGKSHPGRLGSMTMSWLFWAEVASPWQVLGVFSPTGMSSGDPAFLTLGAWLAWAGLGAAVVSLLVVARRSDVARRPAGDSAVADTCFLLCLWLLMPPFLMGLSGQWVFPHYLIVVYPAPFLAVGVLVGRLWAGGRWRRAFLGALVAALVVCNVLSVTWWLQTAATTVPRGGYGLPLAYSEQAAASIAQDARGQMIALEVDPALVDGQSVIDQQLAWRGGRTEPLAYATTRLPRYWVLTPLAPAPLGAQLLRPLGPAGVPVALVWVER